MCTKYWLHSHMIDQKVQNSPFTTQLFTCANVYHGFGIGSKICSPWNFTILGIIDYMDNDHKMVPGRKLTDCRYVSDCRSRGRKFDPTQPHTFVEIDREIICTTILLPSADSRRVVVSYKEKVCAQSTG